MAAAGAAHSRHRRECACYLPPALRRRHRAPAARRRGGGRTNPLSHALRDRRGGARRPGARASRWNLLPAGRRGVSMGLISLALLIAAWYAGSQLAGPRLLPDPQAVALAIVDEARSGALAFNLGATLARVAAAFVIAMALGSVIGLIMGRSRIADRL